MKVLAPFIAALLAAPAAQEPQKPGSSAPAQKSPAATTPRAADTEALASLIDAFVQAFNAGDAKAVAALFTDEARIVEDLDEPIVGRAAIEQRFADAFAARPGMTIEVHPSGVAFLDDNTAVEDGTAIVTRPIEGGTTDEATHYTVVYLKKDGKWLQASVTDRSEPSAVPASEHLAQLEWLVGEWVDESDESEVSTTCTWDENKNFLLRSFTVKLAGRPALSGTQRIGWDPIRRQFRSWVFDSEGGFGEGHWTPLADNAWQIQNSGATADGQPASNTSTVTYVNDHTIHWTVSNRVVGDEPLLDDVEIVMVRKPPKPGQQHANPPGEKATPPTGAPN